MSKIKLCGLTRIEDIEAANELKPDFIGFVFAEKSKRYISPQKAKLLKQKLDPNILAVGVFVNESLENIAKLLSENTIDIAQLHGDEDDDFITKLKELTHKPVIKAFKIKSENDIKAAQNSTADYVLLDSGAGTGQAFNWSLIENIERDYFLAGGLSPQNAEEAVKTLHPYALDVSSGIETNGIKDKKKMADFIRKGKKYD